MSLAARVVLLLKCFLQHRLATNLHLKALAQVLEESYLLNFLVYCLLHVIGCGNLDGLGLVLSAVKPAIDCVLG